MHALKNLSTVWSIVIRSGDPFIELLVDTSGGVPLQVWPVALSLYYLQTLPVFQLQNQTHQLTTRID